jgi:hypothetical protein
MVTHALLSLGCQKPAECNESGGIRSQDVVKIGTGSPITVISLDTSPSVGSSLFQSALEYLGYDYYILGSPIDNPQPKRSGVFKQALWYYRMKRYQNIVNAIAATDPGRIVLMTDANDVLFRDKPASIEKEFLALGKPIVLSGSVYCCNTSYIDYIRAEARRLHIDDVESTDPAVAEIVKQIAFLMGARGAAFGRPEWPAGLWTPAAIREMQAVKAIAMEPDGPATKYRYVNAGGIIGFAGALRAAMEEIDIQPFEDDEERWNLWYANVGYPSGRAIIDYRQKIFAVVNEIEDQDGLVRILFDDIPNMPKRKFFDLFFDQATDSFVNVFGNYPKVFHCGGCFESQMRDYRTWVTNSFSSRNEVFNAKDLEFLDKC